MPLINHVRGDQVPDAMLNVRTPIIRIPLWMVVIWWTVKGLARLAVWYVRFGYLTVPVSLLLWSYLRFGWLGLVLPFAVPAVALTVWGIWHRASFHRLARWPELVPAPPRGGRPRP